MHVISFTPRVKTLRWRSFSSLSSALRFFPSPGLKPLMGQSTIWQREKKGGRKGEQRLGGRRGGRDRQTISVIFTSCCIGLIIRFSLFGLLSIWDTSFDVCACRRDGFDMTASHTSDGHIHETDGHKAATSSAHGEGRKEGDEKKTETEKTGICCVL